jgi:hypothetical protein
MVEDLELVNKPSTDQILLNENVCIYSAYLPPGNHHFMIYHQDQYYTCSFTLDLGKMDHFADFPKCFNHKENRYVWSDWPKEQLVESNPTLVDQIFERDTSIGFEGTKPEILGELRVNFTTILVYF